MHREQPSSVATGRLGRSVRQCLCVLGVLLLLAPVGTQAVDAAATTPIVARVWPHFSGETDIPELAYGVNNVWGTRAVDGVPNAAGVPKNLFNTFYDNMNATGMTMMRFPGGRESEWYDWANNEYFPSIYRQRVPATPHTSIGSVFVSTTTTPNGPRATSWHPDRARCCTTGTPQSR